MTLVILMAGLFSVSTGVAAENVNVTVYLENGEDAYGETATVTIAGNTYTGTVSRSYSWGSYDYYVSLYNVTASRGDAVTVTVAGMSGSGTVSRSGNRYSADVTLEMAGSRVTTLTVTVEDSSGDAIEGAEVSFNGETAVTDSSGKATFEYEWERGDSFDVEVTHPDEDYRAIKTVSGGTSSLTVTLSETFYYKFSDQSSNSRLYYTIDGRTLTELKKGDVLKLDRFTPVSFYTFINPGYTSGSTFAQRSGPEGYTSSWISGTYTAIAKAPDTIGSFDISDAVSRAEDMGCDFQFHYSATAVDFRYREFRVVSEPVGITVAYDPNGGRLNGSSAVQEDGHYYRHPDVTDAAYASYLTRITVPEDIPTRSGYTFAGWSFNDGIYRAGDTLEIEDLWSSEITTEVTYTFEATWTQDPGMLEITKTFAGPDDLPDDFSLSVEGTNGYSTTLLLSDAEKDGDAYRWSLDNLISNVTYSVTEDNYEADGFDFDDASSVTEGSAYVSPGQESFLTLSNVYTVKTFTVIWENEDGTVLETDENVSYGTMPSYEGATPVKDADAENSYVFAGWGPEISPVTEDVTYTAVYSESVNSYTVIWQNEDGTVLETDENVPYGTMPSYDGTTPAKASTPQYHFTFDKWSPSVTRVDGDAVYTATFEATDRYYTVTWLNHNKVVMETDTGVKYGTEIDLSVDSADYDGETPTKAGDSDFTYKFAGWEIWSDSESKDNPITGNTTLIAVYEPVPIPRTATVEVVLDAAFDADDNRSGGENTDIEELITECDGNIYLVNAADPTAEPIPLEHTATGVYSIKGIANGTYRVCLKVNDEIRTVGVQDLTINNADRTRYIPFYSVNYMAEGASNVPASSTHYSGTDAAVSDLIPVKEGAIFSHWTENGTDYLPGGTVAGISAKHTLTAVWQDAAKVNLTVVVDHRAVSDPTVIDTNITGDLSFHLSRPVNGSYASIHSTAKTVNDWDAPVDNVTTYQAIVGYETPALENPASTDFSGFASLAGYRLMSTETVYADGTYDVTVRLQYAPKSFELAFTVKMADGTPEDLIPESADVAIARWDGNEWAPVPGFENRTIEVNIEKQPDGSYSGSGSFAA